MRLLTVEGKYGTDYVNVDQITVIRQWTREEDDGWNKSTRLFLSDGHHVTIALPVVDVLEQIKVLHL